MDAAVLEHIPPARKLSASEASELYKRRTRQPIIRALAECSWLLKPLAESVADYAYWLPPRTLVAVEYAVGPTFYSAVDEKAVCVDYVARGDSAPRPERRAWEGWTFLCVPDCEALRAAHDSAICKLDEELMKAQSVLKEMKKRDFVARKENVAAQRALVTRIATYKSELTKKRAKLKANNMQEFYVWRRGFSDSLCITDLSKEQLLWVLHSQGWREGNFTVAPVHSFTRVEVPSERFTVVSVHSVSRVEVPTEFAEAWHRQQHCHALARLKESIALDELQIHQLETKLHDLQNQLQEKLNRLSVLEKT